MRCAAILLLASAYASTSSTEKPSYLFVQNADNAVLHNPQRGGQAVTFDVEVLEGPTSAKGGPAALFIDNLANWPVVRHGMHDEPHVIERKGMRSVR